MAAQGKLGFRIVPSPPPIDPAIVESFAVPGGGGTVIPLIAVVTQETDTFVTLVLPTVPLPDATEQVCARAAVDGCVFTLTA